MKMKITSVLAKWLPYPPGRKYKSRSRNGKEGVECIETILKDSADSDFLFFPGGFIDEKGERKKTKSDILNLCSNFKGVLITGFDGGKFSSPLIVQDGSAYMFNQAASCSTDDVNKKNAELNRFFEYKGISFAVLSCGEIFNKEARSIIFKNKIPCLLFDCIHNGSQLEHEVLREILNKYCSCAGFYSYHSYSNNIKAKFSACSPEKTKYYEKLLISTIDYAVNVSEKYNFTITRNFNFLK